MAELLSRDDLDVVDPGNVRTVLARSILADGLDLVLDLERSSGGSWLVDARDGTEYLDMFTFFFASSALGMNHPPALVDDAAFRAELARTAINKPSNSDVYTVPMARFVDAFCRVLGDPALPHLFFVDGGALAVENALKVAFDWKSRHNEARGYRSRTRHPSPAPAGRLSRSQRLHPVADEHRPGEGGALPPQIRLAAYRRPPVRAAGGRYGCSGGRVAATGSRGIRGASARHRLLHRRTDPGRGRRPALPAAVLGCDAPAL